ncbi:4-oxalocrotonate tautomerase [Pseudomonas sp. AN-1]|uniref:4-oxalocrotonate tautomerase n=1 Tax=Pseudomonas sp. AN-1 TaxID=3096605 RepID=UPI002A6AB3ED|nr:4-oxalocrotonate tautomerase [Pseudomonas sp. AN-1]WPP47888.1 4-oxalocrotonate tautomerase [Pseudomonas sp. AN-1]
MAGAFFARNRLMPIAHVHIMEGRSAEQKEAMIREVSEALARTLDSPLDRVRVLITEVPKDHWGIGGEPASKVRR